MRPNKNCLIQLLILFFLSSSFNVSAQASSFKLRVTEEIANIRQKPDIRSPIIVQVTQNTILYGLRREGEWYLVTWPDESGTWKKGYIHESLVTIVEAEATAQEKKEETIEIQKEKKAESLISEKEPAQKPQAGKKEPERKVPVSLSQPEKPVFRINLSSGLEYLSLSQLNDSRAGLVSLIADRLNRQPEEKISALHWLPTAGLEFQIPVKSFLSTIFQISGIYAQRKNLITYKNLSAQSSLFIESKLQALPLGFLLSFDPCDFFSLSAGPELILAEYRYLYRLNLEEIQEQWLGKARRVGFGFKGKVAFSMWLRSNLGLLLEISGRRTKLSGFEGTDTHLLPSGETAVEKGKLYYFQVKTSPDRLYPLIFIRQKRPAEAGVEAAEEAILNFSGFSFRIGLGFRF